MNRSNIWREAFAHHWRRTLTALLALAVAVLIVRSAALHAGINAVFVAAQALMLDHGFRGMVLFALLSALSAMIAFFSSAVLVPVGVYAWGPTTTFLLLWLGWLIGGACAYTTGRYLGRRALVWLIQEEQVRRCERQLKASAPFAAILLFQLALPSEVPGYVFGVLRSRFLTYVAALAVAELPFAAGAAFLGDSFIHRQLSRIAYRRAAPDRDIGGRGHGLASGRHAKNKLKAKSSLTTH